MTDNRISPEYVLKRAEGESIRRLYADPTMTAASTSAGFVDHERIEKFQVFVKVCRYSDELLASDPDSGGLLCEASEPDKGAGPDWQAIACAFRFTAAHAAACKSRQTMESDDCNCPLREPMRALRDAMSAEKVDPTTGLIRLEGSDA